jgi:hypothetical protein
MKSILIRGLITVAVAIMVAVIVLPKTTAQKRRPAGHFTVCGNPNVPCKSAATFEPYALPFRAPENSVIIDTELFYAVILKSVGVSEEDCDVFVSEDERLQTQELFPDHKVFTSRCTDAGEMFFTGMSPKHRFMAVYAGATLPEANRILAAVKTTGKFPGANLRRMRTGFNGT